ncbi:Transposase [Thermoplasmatales archaeon SCGC AB-539-C06]|nr:Transposase [Thermoplasmatales archaeon SCGC AB-539-C06]
MKRKRRAFSKEFKLGLLRELENGKKAAEICREKYIAFMFATWRL